MAHHTEHQRRGGPSTSLAAAASAVVLALALPLSASATVALTKVSTDTFTPTTCTASNTTFHHTEVEPDTFSNGSTIVATFQVARIFDGGSCDVGFATSTDGGSTWTHGLLPGLTKYSAGGLYDRATDPSVTYDAKHAVWLISSLTLSEAGGVHGAAVMTSSSADGLTWNNPKITGSGGNPDKNWIVCDNTLTSPHYGNCYTEWDNNGAGDLLQMSTSTDGGVTWGAATTNGTGVIGGQPLVRPDGTVIVPTDNANETAVGAFHSTDGGATWSATTTISKIRHHSVNGGLRAPALPSAEIDSTGTVYVVWADCRFERSCNANDIVISHSLDATGTSWSTVARVPIDPVKSQVDHFIPGLAVNKGTSGSTAQLGLTYYYYASAKCTVCQLNVGFISSTNAGSTWSLATSLAGPFDVNWVANTSQGRMVGDYISTSYTSANVAHSVFMTAEVPSSGANCGDAPENCKEAAYTSQAVWLRRAAARPQRVTWCCSAATTGATRQACGSLWWATASGTAEPVS